MTRQTPPPDPAKPRLVAEWRLVVAYPQNGIVVVYPAETQEAAINRGRRSGVTTWHVEKRYVGPWHATTPELRSILVEVAKAKLIREFDVPFLDDDDATFAPEPGANGQAEP
jgi:hypothetical protein